MRYLNDLLISKDDNFFKFENYILNILVILLAIFPLLLISGPFIPDLVIVLCSFYYVFLTFKNYSYFKKYNNFLIRFLLIFWLYLVFSSLISNDLLFSLRSSFFYLRFIIFTIFVWYVYENYPNFKKYLLISFILAFLFVCFDSIYQFYFEKSLFGNPKPNLRLTGPFKDRQIVGSYLARLLPLVLFLYYSFKTRLDTIAIIFIGLTVFTTLLSGERTSFFMITFFLLMFIFIKVEIKKFILFVIVYTSIIISIIFTIGDLKKRLISQTLQGFAVSKYTHTEGENEYFKNKPNKGFYIFSRSHEVHYATAIKMFLNNKIIGVGPNMFRKECSDDKYYIEKSSCTTHPHNFPLQILAETGLIGMFFYLLLLTILIYKILNVLYLSKIVNSNVNSYNIGIYILHLGFLINVFLIILPSGNFFNNYLCATIFFPLGIYLSQIKKLNE